MGNFNSISIKNTLHFNPFELRGMRMYCGGVEANAVQVEKKCTAGVYKAARGNIDLVGGCQENKATHSASPFRNLFRTAVRELYGILIMTGEQRDFSID